MYTLNNNNNNNFLSFASYLSFFDINFVNNFEKKICEIVVQPIRDEHNCDNNDNDIYQIEELTTICHEMFGIYWHSFFLV